MFGRIIGLYIGTILILIGVAILPFDSFYLLLALQESLLVSLWYLMVDSDTKKKIYEFASFDALSKGVTAGTLIITVVIIIQSVIVLVFSKQPEDTSPFPVSEDITSVLLLIVANFLFIAVAEELVFRGGIYEEFKKITSTNTAILVSSVLFGILHIPSLTVSVSSVSAMVATTVGGAGFAVLYERTDNIVLPIIAHGTYNSLLVVLIYISTVLP